MSLKRRIPLPLLLFAAGLLYAGSLGNAFHFDDFHTAIDNPAIRTPVSLRRVATDATAFSVLPANQTYRPLVTASLALDYALGHGYAPFWFHLSTLLWFLLLIALLERWSEWLFLQTLPLANPRSFDRARWLALALAGWFGLHPVMAETVNYVIQRGDLYCTLGGVAALYLFARFKRSRRFGYYLLPLVLAMLSKPPAAVFPLLLLAYLLLFENATLPVAARWRRSLTSALPAFATTALLLGLQSSMTPRTYQPSILSAAAYRCTQPYVWLRYATALFLPLHLNVDTDLQPLPPLSPRAIAGYAFVLALFAAIAWTARRRRLAPITFGLVWFAVTQLPTSLYALSEVENDHRMFFSFPGPMLACLWSGYLLYEALRDRTGLTALAGRKQLQRTSLRGVTGLLGVACLCGYAYGAHRRNLVWRSEDTLWADDVRKSPHNGRGLMIYGLTRMNAGDLRGALEFFERALVYTPNYATLEINLGVVNGLLADGGEPTRTAIAEAHFERAIRLAPAEDTTHAFYGRWLLGHNRLAEAEAQLRTALAENPLRTMQRDLLRQVDAARQNQATQDHLVQSASPANVNNLVQASFVLHQGGRYAESDAAAREALALDPNSAAAWNNIAANAEASHHWNEAIEAARKALAIQPDFPLARNNLQWSLQQKAAEPR